MNISIYQIQYNSETKPNADAGLRAFDCRTNKHYMKREMAHLIRLYDEIISKDPDGDNFYSLLSPKFSEKSGLGSKDIVAFIQAHPGAEVYLFNPFQLHTYKHLNVWEHAELSHPGICDIANAIYQKAGIEFDTTAPHRNSIMNAVYCNYWAAKKTFFDEFIPFVKRLDSAIDHLPEKTRKQVFSLTDYETEACYYPFIFERVLSSYLVCHPHILTKPFLYRGSPETKMKCTKKALLAPSTQKAFYEWEARQADLVSISERLDTIMETISPRLGESANPISAATYRATMKIVNAFRIAKIATSEP
jgi:hypothetical protein